MPPTEGQTGSDEPGRTKTLSTGHTVELPVRTNTTVMGATFAAPQAGVAALLPEGLEPIRATVRGGAAVTLSSVAYHAVDIPTLEPYDEFAVIIPATHSGSAAIPYASALRHASNGYVWQMPVTTEPARAFGAEIWGYPKIVADVDHETTGSTRCTTVTVDGERFVTIEIDRPPTVELRAGGCSYATKDDRLYRIPTRVEAAVGAWPLTTAVSVSSGDHPLAAPLSDLELGPRAIGRFAMDGDAYFFPGEPL
jgi:hypothetical protein